MACILDYVSLWFVLQRGELRVAIRSCFDPQGIDSARVVTSSKNDCRFVVEGRTGQFVINLQVLKEEREILHYKTKLTPHRPVQMVVSARDLVFGGTGKNEDVEGKVHFTQKGPASAIAYASFRDPKGGTLLYFQNLTSLNEYCAVTHAEPVGIVARRVAGDRDGLACGQRASAGKKASYSVGCISLLFRPRVSE